MTRQELEDLKKVFLRTRITGRARSFPVMAFNYMPQLIEAMEEKLDQAERKIS